MISLLSMKQQQEQIYNNDNTLVNESNKHAISKCTYDASPELQF